MKTSKAIIFILSIAALAAGCSPKESLTKEEKALINDGEGSMRVVTISSREDSLLLRQKSCNFTTADLQSPEYGKLALRMLCTVTDPSQNGVGIAGPQVGLLRRVVAVQRFDKPGEPFEVYPNISIECLGEACREGGEGCLSVPGRRGRVMRHESVIITYTDPSTLKVVSEKVEGFTAVIFQHECDHLDGVLYIDRL